MTGAIVEGIPARGPFKSQGKYWLTVDIDGSVAWKTREVRTKGSMIAWEAKEDRRPLIQVVLCKSHSSGKVEELGAVEQPLDAWLQATEGTDAMRTVAGVDRVEGASEKLDGAAHPVANIGSAWGALLDNVAWFMIAMDAVTEVHPYAKMAWSVLSAAYKVVDAQRKRGDNVRRLVEKMQDVYAFLREAQEMLAITQQPGRDKLREKALADLASQTVECAHFITTYAKDPSFGTLATSIA
ncbi:hypothetical protein CALVIDRAFT_529773 [Calocera viscosa TUFC12733]|uniref:Fungal STAND N-terminal Goodbye domain-containing protein n=1 Tax=Calocera viscosa (strain TUFC12733) TaxID=1330018 RepID=A0A167ITQ5_CALVF|nr:hypothetical protein CALVIDRAFT_529773 [Calocera viscosa TUFC12733]